MLKRVKNRGGFWQGVTGAPEGEESTYEAAKRELFEETGFIPFKLIQTNITYIIPMEDRWIDIYPIGTKQIPEHLFIAIICHSDPPKLDQIEHDKWKWCSLNESLTLLSLENNIRALKYVYEYLKDPSNSIKI